RNRRAQTGVEAHRKILAKIYYYDNDTAGLIRRHSAAVRRLANLSELALAADPASAQSGSVMVAAAWRIELPDAVDVEAHRAQLLKSQQKIAQEIASLEAQLGNEQFLAKASPQVVAGRRQRLQECLAEREKVRAELEGL